MKPIAVIGAGSWGTTLARLMAEKGYDVRLWVREPELCKAIEDTRENTFFLPGIELPSKLQPTTSLEEAIAGTDIIVCGVPSHGIRGVFEEAAPFISEILDTNDGAVIVNASKGIEEGSFLTCCGVLVDVLPEGLHETIVALSGPTFAKEVSFGLPAAATAASLSEAAALRIQEVLSAPNFRVYTNSDPTGVELGGVLKNVIALAAGISDGLGLGANARAALITRGLKEITALGVAMGGRRETFYGLSGLGDLVLTCTGTLSRNHTVGVALGEGKKLDDILSGMKMVAEGVKTSVPVHKLALRHSVEMPITEEVYKVLYEDKPPRLAVMELMTRELKGEL